MGIGVDSANVQSANTSNSNKTLTWSTIGVDLDDIIVVGVVTNQVTAGASMGVPSTTSGSTTAWTQIVLVDNGVANTCGVGVWWAKATATGNITVTQTTTRPSNALGVRGTLFEISGANLATPVGSTDTHAAATDCLASNSNLEIAGERGNLILIFGGNWNASGNNSEDIDSTSDNGYTAVWTGTTRYESTQADYHNGYTILIEDDTTTRGVLDQVSGTGDWTAAIIEIVAAASAPTARSSTLRYQHILPR